MAPTDLPGWAAALRDRYLSGEASLFLVHGNVRDLQPWHGDDGRVEYVDLRTFLERFLARTRDVVVYYNVSQGLCPLDKEHERRLRASVDARRMLDGGERLGPLPRGISETLAVVESLVTDPTRASGVVLDFFEMIAPHADPAFMTGEDKANLVTMRRWSSDPALLATDNLVLLVTESLSDVARSVLASPQLVTVRVPYPEEADRVAFLAAELTPEIPVAMAQPALAKVTAGLTCVQIRSLIQMARQTGTAIDFRSVAERKKVIIEQECHGLVEFVAPRHDLSHVGGMDEVKADLRRVADAVKAGARNRVPMGMIFVGPMGTGKTFVAEAFSAESGLTCLQFKNFRDKWVGSTEANLEKVLELVEALGYVLLIIDEAERALSSGDNDGGVGSRVIARLKEFMSDTSHRGRVVMLMMTNRPDKLDADLKRPGRFDLKIPFFFPETADERVRILRALVRKNDIPLADDADLDAVADATQGYSGAELEAVLLSAAATAALDGTEAVTDDDLTQARTDVIPSRDVRMLGYMEMLAVFECSARRMLPARYRDLDTHQVLERLDALKAQLGRRALT
ncbi:MAG: ATP-binding protein [Alphaproteobacteria bacterium]|nr:ATP-binding protein [Alphaproteobacteria bacterium]